MKFTLAGLLFGLGMWLAAGGSAQAQGQGILIKPNSGSASQRPGANPFQNLSPIGTPTFPGLGSNLPGGFGGTQFIDPVAFQMQGLGQPAVAPPSSGLPPFSTQPPPRYFGNFQPFYPLIPSGGYSSTTAPFGGPQR